MTRNTATAERFNGTWRIIESEMWDRDALDLVAPASLTFEEEDTGRMKFIAVDPWIDYRAGEREGLPAVEFSFRGTDEGDEVCGRAWAVLKGNRLRGRRSGDGAFTYRGIRPKVSS